MRQKSNLNELPDLVVRRKYSLEGLRQVYSELLGAHGRARAAVNSVCGDAVVWEMST